mgnify:CR=1 FL=1|tara:strand:+ start:1549 stop:2562 length:1014 start_codon:yes stop_codon:yes gene_type:complete
MKKKIIIIAEIGVNHDGNIDKAKELIKIAKNCKADYVKLQTFNANELIIKNHKKSTYQNKNTSKNETLFQMLTKLTFNYNQTKKLFEFSKKIGIKCLSTPFDEKSIKLLDKLKMDFYKVSSGDINNFPLLEIIAKRKKPIILSTGRTYLNEIKKSINFLNSKGCYDISILHCTSIYPAKQSDLNLRCIETLQKKFKNTIGYSDHSLGITAPVIAVTLGAKIIEKHITLNRKDLGPDHAASLEPLEFKKMCSDIRNVEKMLGSSIKKPCKNEFKGRKNNRRGLYAAINLKKNQILNKKHISIKRPEAYFSPENFYDLIGKKILSNIKKDKAFNKKNIK